MKLRIAASVVTTLAVVALAPAAASAQTVDRTKMTNEVKKRMDGNAFGWQFAIAKVNGITSAADGTARSAHDNGGITKPMNPHMRYEVASLTKNVTAVATMKLLRLNNLSIETKIWPYLPANWTRSSGFDNMRFRHLLQHTSGINQMIVNKELNDPTDYKNANNNWDGLRWIVKQDVVVDSPRSYKNANYGLLGILNAVLYRRAGGNINGLTIGEFSHAAYQQEFNQKYIFTPSGIFDVGCVDPSPSVAGLNYAAGATQGSTGALLAWPELICAGNAGLRLSSIDIVRYLATLRSGKILHPDDLATMDSLRLGWSENSNGGYDPNHDGVSDNPESFGVWWHDGAFNGENLPQVWTCGMTFAEGTQASLIVNSPMKVDKACGVLIQSWLAAKAS
jgi:CubicO group peptidase (beta-lactamase class C family)